MKLTDEQKVRRLIGHLADLYDLLMNGEQEFGKTWDRMAALSVVGEARDTLEAAVAAAKPNQILEAPDEEIE